MDQYVEQHIYAPLGLHNTLFTPLRKGRLPSEFAATELNGNTRGGRVEFPGIRKEFCRNASRIPKEFRIPLEFMKFGQKGFRRNSKGRARRRRPTNEPAVGAERLEKEEPTAGAEQIRNS